MYLSLQQENIVANYMQLRNFVKLLMLNRAQGVVTQDLGLILRILYKFLLFF